MIQDRAVVAMADLYENIYQLVPFSMTLNDPYPDFEGIRR